MSADPDLRSESRAAWAQPRDPQRKAVTTKKPGKPSPGRKENEMSPKANTAMPMRTAIEVFEMLKARHAFLHNCLRDSRRRGDLEANAGTSSEMITLRDVGRFMLGMDPEDDTNPFGGSNYF
jgi:hypothetical protein